MSVAVTNGVEIVAARYYSEGASRSLFFSTDARALRARYPDDPRVQQIADETRAIVSEPLGDLPGAWQEVPESQIGVVRPGFHELRTFTPRRAADATAV